MKKEFVPFELAEKLKEKGFSYFVYDYYKTSGKYKGVVFRHPFHEENFNYGGCGDAISAPRIHEVLEWLRKEKKIHIIVDICNGYWEYRIKEKIRLDESLLYISQTFPVPVCYGSSYEKAALTGIKYVIDNLI